MSGVADQQSRLLCLGRKVKTRCRLSWPITSLAAGCPYQWQIFLQAGLTNHNSCCRLSWPITTLAADQSQLLLQAALTNHHSCCRLPWPMANLAAGCPDQSQLLLKAALTNHSSCCRLPWPITTLAAGCPDQSQLLMQAALTNNNSCSNWRRLLIGWKYRFSLPEVRKNSFFNLLSSVISRLKCPLNSLYSLF